MFPVALPGNDQAELSLTSVFSASFINEVKTEMDKPLAAVALSSQTIQTQKAVIQQRYPNVECGMFVSHSLHMHNNTCSFRDSIGHFDAETSV